MGHLHVALVIELIDSSMEDNLESVQLRDRAFLLVSQLIDELSEALVVIKVALVVSHVAVQFDFLLVSKDSSLLPLVLDLLQLLLELLVLPLIATDFLFTHGLVLVDRLVVALILHRGVFLEGAPLILQL